MNKEINRNKIRKLPVKKIKKKRRIAKWDDNLLYIIIALSLIGAIMVFSASSPLTIGKEEGADYYFKRHLLYLIISIFLMFLVSLIDYKKWRKIGLAIYIVTFILCLSVRIPGFGVYLNGARRWLNFRLVTIMPSDFLKIGAIILMADLIVKKQGEMSKLFKGLIPLLFFIGITVLPIYLQPDYSTLVVIGVTMFTMVLLGGMKSSHFLIFGILVVCTLVLGITTSSYRMERIMSTFNPLKYRLDEGWQLVNALFGVASGGFTGRGIGKGIAKQAYLSEQAHNDWIFAVISEEMGFLGASIVIILFIFLIYRGFKIAMETDDLFGKLLASGISLCIGFQAFVNMGVSIGLVPSTGITLPFISYGGSALLGTFIMMGILLNISRHNNKKDWLYR